MLPYAFFVSVTKLNFDGRSMDYIKKLKTREMIRNHLGTLV